MKTTLRAIGSALGKTIDKDIVIDTLLTDSRNLRRPASTLFFAIRTPGGNDGHRYIEELYRRGVRNFVVNETPPAMKAHGDANFIEVCDTVAALQTVAAMVHAFNPDITAVTGSRGKTTLKEVLYQLLEEDMEIARSPRSYNSQTGVPLSMWEIGPTTSLAIIEAGISRPGEMEKLADCIKPDTVIFTNIGDEHNEGFVTRIEKAGQKALLAAPDSVKRVIYNADSAELSQALSGFLENRDSIGFSVKDPTARLYVRVAEDGMNGILKKIHYTFDGKEGEFEAPVSEAYDLENTAAALAYMLANGIDGKSISDRFSRLHRIGTRLNVTEGVNGCSLIYDSYTSDFSSLRPAIDFMKRRAMPGQLPTLILSDIQHETGNDEEMYKAVAREVHEAGIAKFIGIGPNLKAHRTLFGEDSLFFNGTADFLAMMSTSDFEQQIILLKGAPSFRFESINEMLEARKHETVLEVNLDAVVSNYNYFKRHIPATTGMICMVKASGYGAGSYEIAKTLQDAGAAYLAVAVLDEGIDLRRNGITMPIMVMNPKVVNYRSMFANKLEPEIYSLEMLRDVIREGAKNGVHEYPVHIKLDTGMHRMGFLEYELPEVMDMILGQDTVRIASVFSHLATADCVDMDDYTAHQLELFATMSDYILSRATSPVYERVPVKRHVLNSAGILRFPEYHYDMVRLGIGLYGANTLPPDIEKPLATVSTLRTVIIAIREYESDATIGYGRRGVLTRKSRIATIPIGYADGMNRHFGRGAVSVKVNGCDAPTVGNICMDACMIDVTDIDCRVGDAVEIFGPDAPVQRLADLLDTIPYEILTSVSPRVKRVYYRES